MRRDEKLKTIFETAAQIIVLGESSWKDYLAFASTYSYTYSFSEGLKKLLTQSSHREEKAAAKARWTGGSPN